MSLKLEAALIDALENNRIKGAALDVFQDEPRVPQRLMDLPHVVLVPHIGSATRATRMKMNLLAVKNLTAALAGKRPPNLLNPEAWARRRRA